MSAEQALDEQVEQETPAETLARVRTEVADRQCERERHAVLDKIAIISRALNDIEVAHANLAKAHDYLAKAARARYPDYLNVKWALEAMRYHNNASAAAIEKAEAAFPSLAP